jgi:biopolymer transport protein ExbD
MKVNLRVARKARIEMLPLIDIVFLLLVFFIYAMLSMAVHRGLPVVLPKSASAEIDKKLVLSVTLQRDGSIYLDKALFSFEELDRAIRMKATGYKDPGVLLFADRDITYQQLFRVMDKIRQAGVTRISLQAEAEDVP